MICNFYFCFYSRKMVMYLIIAWRFLALLLSELDLVRDIIDIINFDEQIKKSEYVFRDVI